jgi:hypothetical protein
VRMPPFVEEVETTLEGNWPWEAVHPTQYGEGDARLSGLKKEAVYL